METTEQRNAEITRRQAKLAQLYKAISARLEVDYIARIIGQDTSSEDLNFQITHSSVRTELLGSTPLHWAHKEHKQVVFDYLMSKGVDYTVKNAEGSTVLHEALTRVCQKLENDELMEFEDSYVNAILQAHARDGNFENPRDRHGFSHFHAACLVNDVECVELFLKNGVTSQHAIHADSPVFPGYTPLHFAVCGADGLAATRALLSTMTRSDATRIADATGATVLHLLLRKRLKLVEMRDEQSEDDEVLAKRIDKNEQLLRLMVDFNDENVQVDDSGLSLLHVACTLAKSKSLVEHLLMTNKISYVNSPVKMDSAFWPGYTALHFAALAADIDMVMFLLDNGASMEMKNAEGTTPFELCLERFRIIDVSRIISYSPDWSDIRFSDSDVKLTDFIEALHYTSKLIFMAQNYRLSVDSSLPLDSPLWPGDTPLHFAVIFFDRRRARFQSKDDDDDDDIDSVYDLKKSTQMIEFFFNMNYFEQPANVLAQDAYGRTPIHLAIRLARIRIFKMLLERNDKIENPKDIDNLSMLHIACLLKNKETMEHLLFTGADANMPILADLKWNMSYDHRVARAGSTPLHIAMLVEDGDMMKKLLSSGADPFAQDVDGICPIHRLLATRNEEHCQIFASSSSNLLPKVAVSGGLTYLHVACIANDLEAVKKLLELGADANATITMEHQSNENHPPELRKLLAPHVGSTPLYFALQDNLSFDDHKIVRLLIAQGGADLFARRPGEPALIHQILRDVKYVGVLLECLRSDDAMRENFESKTGLSLLHVACNALDVALVKHLLVDNREDVNARARDDSPVWPGCTPLHVLLMNLNDRLERYSSTWNPFVEDVHLVLKLLMDNGAYISIPNADGQTAVDLSKKLRRYYMRSKSWLCRMLPSDRHPDDDYYDPNFVDEMGITMFQEACYQNNLTVIEEFFRRGDVDVDRRVDRLACEFAGFTALHFAAEQRWQSLIGSSRQLMTVELLLNHGADVNARDLYDDTPLHMAVRRGSNREKLIEHLVRRGADLNALNIHGSTPFEVLLTSSEVSVAEVEVFLRNGVNVNCYNCITGTGYMSLLLDAYSIDVDAIITTIIEHNPTAINEPDEQGRSIIHNLVSCRHAHDKLPSVCLRFIERGCDIDHQDKSGKTALHTAVERRNGDVVSQLLALNANAAVIDGNGKTAVDYWSAMYTSEERNLSYTEAGCMRYALAVLPMKWELTGFPEFARYENVKTHDDQERTRSFRKMLKKAKRTYVIPGELTLYDFASETGAVSGYAHMSILKRKAVDEFFASMNDRRYGTLAYWLRHHYRKALARPALIDDAKRALDSLSGFSVPDLCSESIFRFLSNLELKYLIAADEN